MWSALPAMELKGRAVWLQTWMIKQWTVSFRLFGCLSGALQWQCICLWFDTAFCNIAWFPQLCSPVICRNKSFVFVFLKICNIPYYFSPRDDLWMWYQASLLCTGEDTAHYNKTSLSPHGLRRSCPWQVTEGDHRSVLLLLCPEVSPAPLAFWRVMSTPVKGAELQWGLVSLLTAQPLACVWLAHPGPTSTWPCFQGQSDPGTVLPLWHQGRDYSAVEGQRAKLSGRDFSKDD